jgi:thiol-disulfide isomerase/thioredoxin
VLSLKPLWPFLILLIGVTGLEAVALNKPAPKFVLTNSHHQLRALSDYKGKVVFLNFWASWCAPCQVELPELNRLAAQYGLKKLRVVAINVDRERMPAKKILSQLGSNISNVEILWDSQSKVVGTYQIEGMPSSFILDPQGRIAFIHTGFHPHDPESWRQEIDRLIK